MNLEGKFQQEMLRICEEAREFDDRMGVNVTRRSR